MHWKPVVQGGVPEKPPKLEVMLYGGRTQSLSLMEQQAALLALLAADTRLFGVQTVDCEDG